MKSLKVFESELTKAVPDNLQAAQIAMLASSHFVAIRAAHKLLVSLALEQNTATTLGAVSRLEIMCRRTVLVGVVSLVLTSCSIKSGLDDSNQFIKEIHHADSYIDGGSYTVSAITSDNRSLYIYADHSRENGRVIAYLDSIDLSTSPDVFSLVLTGMDTRYREHFGAQPPMELIRYIASRSATEFDRNVFGLATVLEHYCAGRFFPEKLTESDNLIDCGLYGVEMR